MPPFAHCKIKSFEKKTSSWWLAKVWSDCSTGERVAGRKVNVFMRDDRSCSSRLKRPSPLTKRSSWLWRSSSDNIQKSRSRFPSSELLSLTSSLRLQSKSKRRNCSIRSQSIKSVTMNSSTNKMSCLPLEVESRHCMGSKGEGNNSELREREMNFLRNRLLHCSNRFPALSSSPSETLHSLKTKALHFRIYCMRSASLKKSFRVNSREII